MRKIIAMFVLLAVLSAAMLMFAACGDGNKEKLVLFTDPNFPPFEFQGADGVMGVDIRIAQAIADEMGRELEIVEAEFDTIIMAIATGQGDLAIAGITITEERKETVNFSIPYVDSVQYFILPSDSSVTIMEDLAGMRVGVAMGYTGQFVMDDEVGGGVLEGTGATVTQYNSAMEAALDMQNGRIDAVVMDQFVARTIAGRSDDLKTIQIKYADGSVVDEVYGVVVPKENDELLEIVNRVVQRLLNEGKIEEWIVHYSMLASE